MPCPRNMPHAIVQYIEEDTNSDVSQWDLPDPTPLEVIGPGKKVRRMLGTVPLSRTITSSRRIQQAGITLEYCTVPALRWGDGTGMETARPAGRG